MVWGRNQSWKILPGRLDELGKVCYSSSVATIRVKPMQPGDVLSVRDAAREVGAHFTTLYRQVQKGKIVYVTFGGNIFIPVLEVERLKKEKKEKTKVASP